MGLFWNNDIVRAIPYISLMWYAYLWPGSVLAASDRVKES